MACHLLDEAKLREPILSDSTLWDLGWHLNKIWEAFYSGKCPLNVISMMAASLFRPKCLKWLNVMNKSCVILSIYLLLIIFSKYEINWMWFCYFHFITYENKRVKVYMVEILILKIKYYYPCHNFRSMLSLSLIISRKRNSFLLDFTGYSWRWLELYVKCIRIDIWDHR